MLRTFLLLHGNRYIIILNKCIFHLKKEGASLWPLKRHLTHCNHTILPRLIHCHHDEWLKFVSWGDEGSITSWLGKDQFRTINIVICHCVHVLCRYRACYDAWKKGEIVFRECKNCIEVFAHQCQCLRICQNERDLSPVRVEDRHHEGCPVSHELYRVGWINRQFSS